MEGCSFDGNTLTENQRDSPSVSAIPTAEVAWVPKVRRLHIAVIANRLVLSPYNIRFTLLECTQATIKYTLENGRLELDFRSCFLRFKVGYMLSRLSNAPLFVCVCSGRAYR